MCYNEGPKNKQILEFYFSSQKIQPESFVRISLNMNLRLILRVVQVVHPIDINYHKNRA